MEIPKESIEAVIKEAKWFIETAEDVLKSGRYYGGATTTKCVRASMYLSRALEDIHNGGRFC